MRTDILEKIPEIQQRLETGNITITALAKEYKVSFSTLQRYLGITPKKRGESWQSLIGQQIANRQVLERDYNPPFKSHETGFKVQCLNCKKIYTVRKSDLEKKCPYCAESLVGRGHKTIFKGDRFGCLEVIDDNYNYSLGAQPKVLCRCVCGTEKFIAIKNLKGQSHSHTISCGCQQQSAGELKIMNLFEENSINYQEQYYISEFSKFAPFDFAIFNNEKKLLGLIEYDGEQHFKPVEAWGGEEKLKIQQERDMKKNQWCKENNIRLIRIPYTDYDKITIEYLLSFFPELSSFENEK